jgi:hypothetical protein
LGRSSPIALDKRFKIAGLIGNRIAYADAKAIGDLDILFR